MYSDLRRFENCTLWYILLENNTKCVGMSLHDVDTYIVFVYLCYSLANSVKKKFWIIVKIFIAYNCFDNLNRTYCISFTYIWFHFYVWFSIITCTLVQDAILYYSLPNDTNPCSTPYYLQFSWFYRLRILILKNLKIIFMFLTKQRK